MQKLFIFGLVICAGLFLSGCTKDSEYNDSKESSTKTQDSGDNTNDSNNDDDNTIEEYDYDQCIQGCEMLWNGDEENKNKSEAEKDKSCKDLCKSGEGMAENNVNACAESDGIMRDACYSTVAENLVDGKICEKVEDEIMQMGCYSTLAENTGDLKYCDSIKDEMYRGFCKEQE